MSKTKQVTYILLAFAAIIFLPLIGSFIHHQAHFPPGFFAYPMLTFQQKAPFSWPVFSLVAIIGLAIMCLYLFPSRFGFKKTHIPHEPHIKKVKWPLWFWVGLIAFGASVFFLWTKSNGPILFLHW